MTTTEDVIVTSEKVGKYTINIKFDFNPESPREWDNLGTTLYSSTRYTLGDINVEREGYPEDFVEDEVIHLPVFAYIHSGIALSTGPFSCPWDSGQCGRIYVTKEKVREEFGWKNITKKRREKIEDILRSEIKTFSKYLAGEVYGFEIVDETGEVIESCWGYYDEEDAIAEAKNCLPSDE